MHGDATEIYVLERAGIARPPDLVLAVTGDDEDNMVISQIAQGGLRRAEGDRARQRSAQPGAFRPARDHADGLRDVGHPGARRARGARARARATCSSCGRRASRSSRCRSSRVAGRGLAARVASPSRKGSRLISVFRHGRSELVGARDGHAPGDQVLAIVANDSALELRRALLGASK